MSEPYNILFLCTGNCSRSIMAEAILNHRGAPNFIACSAGSHPVGRVNAYAFEQIEGAGLPTVGLRSKSSDEFAGPGMPRMHSVFTLCDSAASEVCPIGPGQPVRAHWGLPDPGDGGRTREELECSFHAAFAILDRRIGLFLALPLRTLERQASEREVRRVGQA